jgi:hypothetical protein
MEQQPKIGGINTELVSIEHQTPVSPEISITVRVFTEYVLFNYNRITLHKK